MRFLRRDSHRLIGICHRHPASGRSFLRII